MGAGSGGWYAPSPKRVDDLLDQKRDEMDVAVYQYSVNGLLQEILQDLNNRDAMAVQRHLDAVKKVLKAEIDGTVDLLFGGSIPKHTYVDGLSDVDVLAILNRRDVEGKSPKDIIEGFANRLRQRFPGPEITPGKLAVTIRYSDGIEIQILPAIRTATGLRIARSIGDGWSNVIRPDTFARKLTAVNRLRNGQVVPAIKLFKALVDTVAGGQKLSGYHVESLAIEVFEHYSGSLTQKEMLYHLVKSASELVKAPIKDRTGQSVHVDDYLGTAGSQARIDKSMRLQRLAKRIEGADRDNDTASWREMFSDD